MIGPSSVWVRNLVSYTKGKQRLRVSETRVLRSIFGPKREEVAGGWRRLHNEGLHNVYTSQNTIKAIKSRMMRGVGHVARMGEMRNLNKILVETPRRRPRRRW